MSKSIIEPGSDNAVEAKQALSEKGVSNYEVVVAAPNQIMIDYDALTVPERFNKVGDILRKRFPDKGIECRATRSKGGNVHMVVTLPEPISDTERIAWQAAFGSDPIREALSLVSISRNVKNPVLLFMPKDRGALEEPTGRKFRTEE